MGGSSLPSKTKVFKVLSEANVRIQPRDLDKSNEYHLYLTPSLTLEIEWPV